jgi:hypothetical protein
MNADVYLLDANVLSRLSAKQRRSPFLHAHCRIPTEVLYEIQGFPDIERLRALEFPLTADVLKCLSDVMKTVEPNDFKLVDLYGNKGNADPILVAMALTGMRQAADTLFKEKWVVVSDDQAVRAKASELGVGSLGTMEFVLLLPTG